MPANVSHFSGYARPKGGMNPIIRRCRYGGPVTAEWHKRIEANVLATIAEMEKGGNHVGPKAVAQQAGVSLIMVNRFWPADRKKKRPRKVQS